MAGDNIVWIELLDIEQDRAKDMTKKLRKMHCQLGHPSMKVFLEILKTTNIVKEGDKYVINIVNKLYESCSTCIEFSKSKPRPNFPHR